MSRAPCSSGRVSPAKTLTRRPAACAAYTGASAVPMPAVASAPALQCVNTRAPSGTKARPCCPMAAHISRSSSRIAVASSRSAASSAGTVAEGSASARAVIRSSAHDRFTAVGRAAARRFACAWRRARSVCPSSCAKSPSEATSPSAAATPIAGAPRTASVAIASRTSLTVRRSRSTNSLGRRRWSMTRTASPSGDQRTAWMGCTCKT